MFVLLVSVCTYPDTDLVIVQQLDTIVIFIIDWVSCAEDWVDDRFYTDTGKENIFGYLDEVDRAIKV